MKHIIYKYTNITNRKFSGILFTVYFFVLFFFIYKTSNTLPPFRDEAVSLTANIGFFLNGLSFEGPRNTIFEGLYNPYLTSPPLSAVGSSLAWKIFR